MNENIKCSSLKYVLYNIFRIRKESNSYRYFNSQKLECIGTVLRNEIRGYILRFYL